MKVAERLQLGRMLLLVGLQIKAATTVVETLT